MGVTSTSLKLIEQALQIAPVKNVMELGAQNLYDKEYPVGSQPYASVFYEAKGIEYSCIDLNGENNALQIDLEKKVELKKQFDLVTDFGTGEHVRNAYNIFKVLHDLTKRDSIIIRQNPKTGSWKGPGFWYATEKMYQQLASAQGYEIIEVGEDAAMGNTIDGWNVYCIYIKSNDDSFMDKKNFQNQITILSE
jgi:hypothetical protein